MLSAMASKPSDSSDDKTEDDNAEEDELESEDPPIAVKTEKASSSKKKTEVLGGAGYVELERQVSLVYLLHFQPC